MYSIFSQHQKYDCLADNIMKVLALAFSFVVLFIACNNSDEVIPVSEEDVLEFSDNVINDELADIPVVIYGNKKRHR